MGALWCADCRAPSSGGCLAAHDVRIPAVALRQGVRDLVPRAREQVDGLQEGLPQGFPDNDNLSVLRLLCGAPSTCTLSIRQDDGEAFSAECRLEGEALLQALVVSLGSSGRLLREPRVKQDESRTEASASPPLEDLIPELNLGELSQSAPGARQAEKESTLTLVRQRGVRRMTKVYCVHDPAWVLAVLRGAAATVEELSVGGPREAHLVAVHAMPRLRRLRLDCGDGALDARPPVLPALPAGAVGRLQLLRVHGLPRATLASLLQAHSATLDEVWLRVGTPGGGDWPKECGDLHALLGQCGLRDARLVLQRWYRPCPSDCRAQLAAVRRVLPSCTVQCLECDKVAFEDF